MKAVCDSLGVARSNVHARLNRPDTWKDERKGRTSSDDQALIDELKVEIEPPRNSRRLVGTSGQPSEAGCPVSCR